MISFHKHFSIAKNEYPPKCYLLFWSHKNTTNDEHLDSDIAIKCYPSFDDLLTYFGAKTNVVLIQNKSLQLD
jgi:hypothetical protein